VRGRLRLRLRLRRRRRRRDCMCLCVFFFFHARQIINNNVYYRVLLLADYLLLLCYLLYSYLLQKPIFTSLLFFIIDSKWTRVLDGNIIQIIQGDSRNSVNPMIRNILYYFCTTKSPLLPNKM